MPIAYPPLPATRTNAIANNYWLAEQIRDYPDSDVRGRRSAHGGRCTSCNRKPGPRNKLCEIVLDPARELVARIGIGVCHYRYLRTYLKQLVEQERAGEHPLKRERIARMQRAIKKLSWHLPEQRRERMRRQRELATN